MKKNRARFISVILLFFCLGFTTMNYNTISAEETTSTKLDNNADVAYITINAESGTDANTFTYKVSDNNTFETDVLIKGGESKKITVLAGVAYTIEEISNGNFDTETNIYKTGVLNKKETEVVSFKNTQKSKKINEGAVTNILQSAESVNVKFAYYEKYSDGTYGFHTKDDTTITKDDNKVIIEDGYCLYDTAALEKLIENLKDDKNLEVSVKLDPKGKEIYESGYGKESFKDVNFIKLKNINAEDAFVDLLGNEAKPVQVHVNLLNLNYKGEIKPICEDTWYNPLFSDTIYFDSKEAVEKTQFDIRTPRNLDNIDRVNEDWKFSNSEITYTQTNDLNFADFTATSDTFRYYKDGLLINAEGASINPNSTGAIVINTFNGKVYNGNGKKIMNLTINGNSANTRGVTIFERNSSNIKNCTVENATLEKTDETPYNGLSALVGKNLDGGTVSESKLTGHVNIKSEKKTTVATGGLVAINEGGSLIENCEVATKKGSSIKGYSSVGGIVGQSLGNAQVKGSKIAIAKEENLTISGAVDVNDKAVGEYIGGIVGENHGAIAVGSIEGTLVIKGNNAGGIAGLNGYENELIISTIKISDCIVSGDVTVNGENIGGIVGRNNGSISNCNVNGILTINATGYINAGGIAGNNTKYIDMCKLGGLGSDMIQIKGTSHVGGIAGNNGSSSVPTVATITNSEVNSKNITIESAGSFVGGIAGWNYGEIRKSKVLGTTGITGGSHAGGIAGVNGNDSYRVGDLLPRALVVNCEVTDDITISAKGDYAGGITGYNNADIGNPSEEEEDTLVNHVTGQVKISAGSEHAGGIAGYNNSLGIITGKSEGLPILVEGSGGSGIKITAKNYAGGITGTNNSGKSNIEDGDKAVYGSAFINYSKVDGNTEIGDVRQDVCDGNVGGIAGTNSYNLIEFKNADGTTETKNYQAEIKNSTVGSASNNIKVSSFYASFVYTIAEKIVYVQPDENNEDKRVFGWVTKSYIDWENNLVTEDTRYPTTN